MPRPSRSMTSTSVSFGAEAIPEDEAALGDGAGSSSESLLQELEIELVAKVDHMRSIAERLTMRLRQNFQGEMIKLPKVVRGMTMREFCVQYGGDVDEAIKQQAKRSRVDDPMLVPPAAPAPAPAASKAGANKRGGRSVAAAPAAPSSSARGKRNATEAAPVAAVETPGARGRSTRARIATATPSAASKGLATPAAGGGGGTTAVMFTPRMDEAPRVMKGGETGYSANGSPISVPDTVKARGGKRGRDASASVALTLADGSEMDLSDAETLKKLDGDDDAKAFAVSQLQQIQAQVEAHLKALKAPHVPEM